MLGLAQGAFDKSVPYTFERKQFGKPVGTFQGMQFQMAEAAVDIEAARLLTYNAARRKDQGLPFAKQAAMAKYLSSVVAQRVAGSAIEWAGGVGFTRETGIEKYWRDSKIVSAQTRLVRALGTDGHCSAQSTRARRISSCRRLRSSFRRTTHKQQDAVIYQVHACSNRTTLIYPVLKTLSSASRGTGWRRCWRTICGATADLCELEDQAEGHLLTQSYRSATFKLHDAATHISKGHLTICKRRKNALEVQRVPNISRTVDAGINRSPSIHSATKKKPKSMLYRKACRPGRASDADDNTDVDGDINGDMHSG